MRRIIQWESQHLEINPVSGKLESSNQNCNENELDENYWDDNENYISQKVHDQNIMATPFGLWKVDDAMNPYKQFKLWIGHTNFSISPIVVEIIKNVPGVEVLKILTRYRFIVGVGELFDIRDVRTTIERSLSCNCGAVDLILDDKVKEQVFELKSQLSEFDRWAIYVFPNGNIDFTTSNEENFIPQLNLYKEAVDFSRGVLIESYNE